MGVNKDKTKRIAIFITDFIILSVGAAIAALALELFLVPNNLLDGGINGVSIVLNKISGLNLSILIFVLNLPFLYVGSKHLGKKFLIKAVYSMLLFSCLLSVFHHLAPITSDVLLAAIFGGLTLGVGVGFVIRVGGSLNC